jgi:O-acetyl-ADP-ribose deacetylase (regulator of RNase III)
MAIFEEVKQDLFSVHKGYYLAHCISTDAAMGAGIAKEFKRRFGLELVRDMARDNLLSVGDCILDSGRVFNLVTKPKYWHKPTYGSLQGALESMRVHVMSLGITHIAMPTIGCGLDKLQWGVVKEIIKDVYKDVDCHILVCSKE